jgi:putative iron-only hydrogenase system regulator
MLAQTVPGRIFVKKTAIGTVSIVLERHVAPIPRVNELISQFGDCIVGRLGLPYPTRGVNIITLIVEAPSANVKAFTAKLGKLAGVQVKAVMAKSTVSKTA